MGTFTRNHLRILVLPTQLSKFLEPDSLSGSKNFDNCVGSTNMKQWFLVKVRLIDFFYSTVILGCFSVWIYLILSEPTQFQPTQNHIFGHFFLCKTIFLVRQDRYEYYEDYKDLETVLFEDLGTVP